MALEMGIIGYPNVGKSTLLNALTHAHAEASNYPFCTIDRNVGAAAIDDPRLDRLAGILEPDETIPSSIRFVDIAGLVRGASKGEGLGNQFLGHVREVDALVHVVRCFPSETIVHVEGSIDPGRDFGVVETELLLADMEAVDRHRAKIESRSKADPKAATAERAACEHLSATLSEGIPLRRRDLSVEEAAKAHELALLTAKPQVVVANVAEDDPGGTSVSLVSLRAALHGEPVLPLAISLEEELARLDPEERKSMMADLGIPERGIDRLIAVSRDLLRLITFYTTAHGKLQAWLVPAGTKIPRAAGMIHSDMERGFIRAEIFRPEDLEAFGSRAGLHGHGRIRIEGKDYVVQDGDICHILFQS
jgi:ribosome-binding ATPase